MRNHGAFLFVACAALCSSFAASCADLPTIAADTCGNRVVDGKEDCDTFGVGGTTACRPKGTVGECRFDCASATCPTGFSCGADGICRAPSATFASSTTIPTSVEQIVVADFDGDGHSDVVTQAPTGLRVHFFAQTGPDSLTLANTTLLPVTRGRIIGGSLTGDGLSSLTVVDTAIAPIFDYSTGRFVDRVVGGGIDVWRSQANHTLLPTIYPSFPVVHSDTNAKTPVKEAMVLGGVGSNFHPGQDLFIISDTGSNNGFELAYLEISPTGTPKPISMLPLPLGPSAFAGLPPIGRLSISPALNECDSIVIAQQGATSVSALPLCKFANGLFYPNVNDPMGQKYPGPTISPITLTMPATLKVAGRAFIADANRDGLNDVLVTTGPITIKQDTFYPLLVAYGTTLGTHFSSTPDALSKDDTFSAYKGGPTLVAAKQLFVSPFTPPLAIGFIDGDDTLDWVEPTRIRFGAPDTLPFTIGSPSSTGWTEARIVDTNGNGAADVVAISSGGVDFYNGTGSVLMNHQANSFDGTPSHMVIGDLDGDLALDIAVSVSGDSASQSEAVPSDALYVQYGTSGFPQPPTLAGRVPPISEMDTATVSWLNGTPDYISSIGAISKINGLLYAVAIRGSSSRALTSPFTLATVDGLARGAAFDATVGNFLPQDPNGASRTALATIAIDTLQSNPQTGYKGQLWAAPVSGAAQFDATLLVPTPPKVAIPLDPGQLTGSRILALDLDPAAAGGIDEALIFVPPVKKTQVPGMFFVNALDAKNKAWSIRGAPQTFDAMPTTRTFPLAVAAADVDGDGHVDVLVFGGDGNGSVFAKVMFNDLTGALDYTKAVAIPLPPNTTAIAALDSTTVGVGATIVALTADGIATIPKANGDRRAFGTPGVCAAKARSSCAIPFPKNVSQSTLVDLRAADVDGDGVQDLVVATQTGLAIYKQLAVKP